MLNQIISLHKNVVGMNQRNHQLVAPNNPRKHHKLADDKAVCKQILHRYRIPTPETYCVIERMGEMDFMLQIISKLNAVAIKPANGSGGGGILILSKNKNGQWAKPSGKVMTRSQLKVHFANILFGMFSKGSSDKVIAEYCLQPHPFFLNIYENGVPDFRVILHKNKPLLAMLRMPTDQSDGKANLHAGAIGIGIDLATGELKEGFDGQCYFNRHPDSMQLFWGKQLPEWEQTLAIALKTAEIFPLDYLGIDIVFDKDLGPMVIEINVRPGIQIQNVHRKGLAQVLREKNIKI